VQAASSSLRQADDILSAAGEIYNVGSGQEKMNIDVVKGILRQLKKTDGLIKFVKDRPGHDIRYALNISKISQNLGWKPKMQFAEGLKKTVEWYVQNRAWSDDVTEKDINCKKKLEDKGEGIVKKDFE